MKRATKKNITIVTEGDFDAAVLKKLFSDKKLKLDIEILPAYGYSSALSKVKSLLTLRDKNIILLLDTDTTEINEIKQKEDFVNSYININLNKDNFKTFWAIPEFEIIFLNNNLFLNELMKKKISKDMYEIAKTSPKNVLETISKKNRKDYIAYLEKKEIRDEFFKEGLIKDIYEYLTK